MTTTNMPCTINTCHHYQVLFCKKIITTWQSPPHDNHYLMTTTTTWQSPPHICQPILLGKCLLTTILSEQAILWFDLYCYLLSKQQKAPVSGGLCARYTFGHAQWQEYGETHSLLAMAKSLHHRMHGYFSFMFPFFFFNSFSEQH